jgi:DNA repair protein RecN (Recombination protein N)
MLVSLEIKNFLLIKKISINFINGFNAFTGETGAGKSIIIEGLKLALGGKNQTNLNLKENEISSIKAVFEINNLIKKNLDELNLIIEDDYLIVERQINSNQKSKLLVNGEIKPLNNIKGILKNVIEFQENFEQQELFDNKYFLKFIDNIGGIEKDDLKSYFKKLKDSKNIYQAHLDNEKNINEKLEILKIKNNKIKILNPTKNEYEELLNKRNLNKNIKKYSDISNEIKKSISIYNSNDNLNLIEKNLYKLEDINQEFSHISQKFASLILDINELINDLENKFNSVDYDEINFDEIDEKIYQYQQLSKFFKVNPENLYSIKEEILIEIDSLENFDKEKKNLFNKYINDLNNYKKEALKISNLRKKESKKISENINKQLPIVNIEQGQIIFKFSEKDEKDYNSQGYDELDVLFRTNKNSDFSSIKKVASGGELSRLLLIIKSLSANNDKDLTLIFDEVDSGLSGKIASNVSEKIDNISKKNQVIAITHSPQVASKANKHWKIEKVIKNDEMTSEIFELNDESRVNEIASLISGAKITETAKKVASDLLQN